MVNRIESLKNGIVHWVWICLIVSLFLGGIYLVKWAWQSSNPTAWLWEPNSLYTDGNDTLTKEKWNALVEKVNNFPSLINEKSFVSNWINVSTISTAPWDWVYDWSWRNVYTVNHNLNTTDIKVDVLFKNTDWSIRQVTWLDRRYVGTSWYWLGYRMKVVDSNTINVFTLSHPSYYSYLSHWAAHRSSWQYKVKVTAF